MNKIPVALLVIGFVLLTPVWLPVALILHGIYLHRLRRSANRFRCVTCGVVLGRAALRLADDEWRKVMEERRRQHPGVRLRVVRTLHAICLCCGQRYRFVEREQTFVANDS
jgi:hypothetical protein